ncbi:alpha/beta-hydrolase [Anaeromyces robustus]|uniref:Alpha/beta-hydrolase n=1 Tax=Anaeromyces robustus TaxID=1754192 RepID=A0A1Y1VX52_9FUNG|nr:alpha/beta-hydrolase [Anaeromyces robustus]|eukprot:ORX65793.1 alpha/beta-hydrolase [Anaeromyces robustus]
MINPNANNNNEDIHQEKYSIEKNGFNGIYFPGTKSPEKAIIVVGGASCDEKISVLTSRYLRNEGYNVLVLGFYLWKGMSKDVVSIPIDYVEKAVIWLKNEKGIKGIAMTGISTGASYTLISASLIPDISCIIPVVPYDYVMEGVTGNFKRLRKSVYTWHGNDIPYSPFDIVDLGTLKIIFRAMRDKKYGLKRVCRYIYDQNSVTEESRIKIENIHADILLLGVKDDDEWPSDVAVERMYKLLKEANYPYRVEFHIYEKASHILADGTDEITGLKKWVIKHMIPAEKKYPKECEEARQDSIKRILDFLEKWEV